jgi:DNA-binding PadR family transcriptional regulator
MPRTKTYLTPAEYAVLGLLRQKPTYGYELQRHLSGNQGLGRVCPVEPAMVYAILKSLSGLELIDGQWDSSSYPPKAVYAATAEGDAEFLRWLSRPVLRMREVRLDFLIKLFFALKEDDQLARVLVEAQIEVCQQYAAGVAEEMGAAEVGLFDAIVLESRASAAALTQEWLELALRLIDSASLTATGEVNA